MAYVSDVTGRDNMKQFTEKRNGRLVKYFSGDLIVTIKEGEAEIFRYKVSVPDAESIENAERLAKLAVSDKLKIMSNQLQVESAQG